MLMKEEPDLAQRFLPPRAVKIEKSQAAPSSRISSRIRHAELWKKGAVTLGHPCDSLRFHVLWVDPCAQSNFDVQSVKSERRRRWLTYGYL
jgi:hypothetical protein